MQNYERRRYKRLPIGLHLEINHMFRQDYQMINNLDAEISVFDISKSGIGFISEAELPLYYYFNAKIKLNQDNYFYTVVKIVRASQNTEHEYVYGAEFVGLAPFLANKIDSYEDELSHE